MSEMERIYRRRMEAVRWSLLALAIVLLAFAHFTFGPLFPPLILAALTATAFAMKGERLLFPLAWTTFDAPKPCPALEEEARTLARALGVPLRGLRVSPAHSTKPKLRWRGRTAVVSTALRDLPPAERRFVLARALVSTPDAVGLFGQFAALPTFYLGFAAWAFGLPGPATAFAALLVLWLVLTTRTAYRRDQTALQRALAATNALPVALAVLRRERDLGSPRAKRDLAALAET